MSKILHTDDDFLNNDFCTDDDCIGNLRSLFLSSFTQTLLLIALSLNIVIAEYQARDVLVKITKNASVNGFITVTFIKTLYKQ